ncbi:MAG TPA: pyridoxamine 5'-phosphate oxidase family protein [Candidatus Limnocylindrales bacterium]|nr:pyridoxamine 5'-phosphate oxidase family protein [Candidatus Limnocylindrales bacterium]
MALERLARERVAWLTTVTPEGQPQTMPIWFLWLPDAPDGGEILVYGDRRARRNRNLEANDRVSLALRTDEHGNDVAVIEGRATMDPDYPQVYDNPGYLAKYGASIDGSFGGARHMAETYDVPIRIRPTRVVGY